MFGYDHKETVTREVDEVPWKLGLLPDGRYEEFAERWDREMEALWKHQKEAHPSKDPKESAYDVASAFHCAECRAIRKSLTPLWREIVREGVRGLGVEVPAFILETEPAEFAGQNYEVLAPVALDKLQVMRRGKLLQNLAHAVLEVNRLDTAMVLGFLS
jgi:hypothetical protein